MMRLQWCVLELPSLSARASVTAGASMILFCCWRCRSTSRSSASASFFARGACWPAPAWPSPARACQERSRPHAARLLPPPLTQRAASFCAGAPACTSSGGVVAVGGCGGGAQPTGSVETWRGTRLSSHRAHVAVLIFARTRGRLRVGAPRGHRARRPRPCESRVHVTAHGARGLYGCHVITEVAESSAHLYPCLL